MNIKAFSALSLVLLLVFTSCNRRVTRIDPDKQIDLSGRWNDTDSRLVAEAMISNALTKSWIADHSASTGKKPVVIVGLVRNKSHEHINTETFIKDIEREFINSGKVRIVQASDSREELRKERADQQEFASKETAKKWGMEKGADFMMQGSINTIIDQYKKEKVVYYQVDIELTHLQTNEKVWIGTKKIKKFIKN